MSPRTVTRAQCGLIAPWSRLMQPRGQQLMFGITAHITVTPSRNAQATWREIQRSYMTGNNVNHETYGDIPYNVGVSMAGEILEGRDQNFVGAHALSTNNLLNRQTVGVAFICEPGELTDAAREAFRAVVLVNAIRYHRTMTLLCHSDARYFGGPPTGCPDDPIRAFVRQVAAGAK